MWPASFITQLYRSTEWAYFAGMSPSALFHGLNISPCSKPSHTSLMWAAGLRSLPLTPDSMFSHSNLKNEIPRNNRWAHSMFHDGSKNCSVVFPHFTSTIYELGRQNVWWLDIVVAHDVGANDVVEDNIIVAVKRCQASTLLVAKWSYSDNQAYSVIGH